MTGVRQLPTLLHMAAPRIMTTTEVANRLQVSVSTAQRFADNGRLTPIHRRPLLWDAEEVDRLAAELADELRERIAHLESEEAAS